MKIDEVFRELGYKLVNHGNYYSTSALYRNGSSPTSLTIYPKTNVIIDWVTGEKFSLSAIVQASLQLSDPNQAKQWLEAKNIRTTIEQPELTLNEPKIFPAEILRSLKPDHSYWLNRGISKEVLEEFRGGVCDKEMMKNRYVIPVFNKNNDLVGLVGRTLVDSKIKYKIKGNKNSFRHAFNLSLQDIKQKKEIILVESQGCVLSLFQAGIRNCLCLFGISLSNEQLSSLIALDLSRIIIATNNDMGPGVIAAAKLEKRLRKFFDKRQVEIRLPDCKDFNCQLIEKGVESIKDWYENKK